MHYRISGSQDEQSVSVRKVQMKELVTKKKKVEQLEALGSIKRLIALSDGQVCSVCAFLLKNALIFHTPLRIAALLMKVTVYDMRTLEPKSSGITIRGAKMFTVNQDHSFGFPLCIHAKRKLVLYKYERSRMPSYHTIGDGGVKRVGSSRWNTCTSPLFRSQLV